MTNKQQKANKNKVWHYIRIVLFILYGLGSAPTILIGSLKTLTSLAGFDIIGIKTNLYSIAVPIVGLVILYILFFYTPKKKTNRIS